MSYTLNEDYLDNFQGKYRDFVKENALPKIENNKVEIKYLAMVEKVKEITPNQVARLNNYYIWDKEYVKSYLENKKGYAWILRIYELPEPQMREAKRFAITFAKLDKDISIDNANPVLNDNSFSKIKNNLKI